MIAPYQPYRGALPMPFELTVGLLVVDPEKYAQYRAEIAPLLEAAGADSDTTSKSLEA
jgi:hypothetical protein